MSEAKFKNVEWRYTASKNGRHQISEVGGSQVAMLWNCHKRLKNAYLIAAAPEMYYLLEDIYNNQDLLTEDAKLDIEMLLAKARGEL